MGLNEQEAQQKELDFGVVRVDYHRAVRGIVSGEEGFLKMIYDTLFAVVLRCLEQCCMPFVIHNSHQEEKET